MVKVHDPFPSDEGIAENCCICREPTYYWYQPKDVALCKKCAHTIEEEDIPTKIDWILQEELAELYI